MHNTLSTSYSYCSTTNTFCQSFLSKQYLCYTQTNNILSTISSSYRPVRLTAAHSTHISDSHTWFLSPYKQMTLPCKCTLHLSLLHILHASTTFNRSFYSTCSTQQSPLVTTTRIPTATITSTISTTQHVSTATTLSTSQHTTTARTKSTAHTKSTARTKCRLDLLLVLYLYLLIYFSIYHSYSFKFPMHICHCLF